MNLHIINLDMIFWLALRANPKECGCYSIPDADILNFEGILEIGPCLIGLGLV